MNKNLSDRKQVSFAACLFSKISVKGLIPGYKFSRSAFFAVLFLCVFMMCAGTGLPAAAQYAGVPSPAVTATPVPGPSDMALFPFGDTAGFGSAPDAMPEPMDVYGKMIVPTNQPQNVSFVVSLPDEYFPDEEGASRDFTDETASFQKIDVDLKKASSVKMTYGLVWNKRLYDPDGGNHGVSDFHGINLYSGGPSIDLNLDYDSSTGDAAILYEDKVPDNMQAFVLKTVSGKPVKTMIRAAKLIMDIPDQNSTFGNLSAKCIEAEESGSEAVIRVFGEAYIDIGKNGSAADGSSLTAHTVDLTVPETGGTISADIGAVWADVAGVTNINEKGVVINAKGGDVIFTSGRSWYYTFYADDDPYNFQKQCYESYPGNITVSAKGTDVNVYGAHLTTGTGGSILFRPAYGGAISVEAEGSSGSAYGLYTRADDGTINAVVDGSITEAAAIPGAAYGTTAAIAAYGAGGTVNIQVGTAPTENPPSGISVSGSKAGLYNNSDNAQKKNIVIYGTLSGGDAAILTEAGKPADNLNLAVWAITLNNGHAAYTRKNNAILSDELSETVEKNIRYIIPLDPSVTNVTLGGAEQAEDLSVEVTGGSEELKTICEASFDETGTLVFREDMFVHDMSSEPQSYFWAHAGDTVTLTGENGGYILSAKWGTGADQTMECSEGSCSFTVPKEGGVWINSVVQKEDAGVSIDGGDRHVTYGDTGIVLTGSVTVPGSEGTGVWTWSADDTNIAEIDPSTGAVTVKNAGTVHITADYASDQSTGSAQITLTVDPKAIKISAEDKSKNYDNDAGTDPELTAEVEGVPDSGDEPVYSLSREAGQDAGEYPITVTADADRNPNYTITIGEDGVFRITAVPIKITAENKSKEYDNDESTDPELTAKVEGVPENGVQPEYSLSREPGQAAGEYVITVLLKKAPNDNYQAETADGTFLIKRRAVTVTAKDQTVKSEADIRTDTAQAELSGALDGDVLGFVTLIPDVNAGRITPSGAVITDGEGNDVSVNYDIKYAAGTLTVEGKKPHGRGDNFFPFLEGTEMPATGITSGSAADPAGPAAGVAYQPVRMSLQIPTLNVEAELVTVPLEDQVWQVQRLGNYAGLLEGSAVPGEGPAVIAAHNTINDSEYGPFALLGTLEINDLIMVNAEDGSVKFFRVYANELFEPDDMAGLTAAAGTAENTLVLITCENESLEGGYLHRRVIFAK